MSYSSETTEAEVNHQETFEFAQPAQVHSYPFQIQSPANLYRLQQIQSQEQMEGYKKYEGALDNFHKQLDGILRRQEKNETVFNGMFSSIMKSANKVTQEIGVIQKEVVSLTDNMAEAMTSLDNGLEDCTKHFEKEMSMVLNKLENTYKKHEEKEAVKLALVVGDMANVIYNYAG